MIFSGIQTCSSALSILCILFFSNQPMLPVPDNFFNLGLVLPQLPPLIND